MFIKNVLAFILLLVLPLKGHGENITHSYPEKQIELIVPYSAGGGVSAMARAFAKQAQLLTGKPWVVINKEGAGGVVGFTTIANANSSGYIVGFSPASPLTNAPFVNEKMPYKPSQILPVCQVFENVFSIAVHESSPIQTFDDFIKIAKSNPRKISYGHAGNASVGQLSMAALENDAGILLNSISYRGDAPAIKDVMGGVIDVVAPAISSIIGKPLRVLAVFSNERHPAFPDSPTLKELGYRILEPGLNGLFVPIKTPRPVVLKLTEICQKVTESIEFKNNSRSLYQSASFLTTKDFQERLSKVYRDNERIIPTINLKHK